MGLDSQAFTAFGATCIDHGTAAACFHADQKAVGTRAACFRRLVSAFHLYLCLNRENRRLSLIFKPLSEVLGANSDLLFEMSPAFKKISFLWIIF
jgi:hypothetical protein